MRMSRTLSAAVARSGRSTLRMLLASAAVTTCTLTWACTKDGSTGVTTVTGEIVVRSSVTGAIPTGMWTVTVVHSVTSQQTSRELAANASVTFSNLAANGTWSVEFADINLGPFNCSYSGDATSGTSLGSAIDLSAAVGASRTLTLGAACTEQLSADAGVDQSVDVGAVATLDGSGSTGAVTDYVWALLSKPSRSAATVGPIATMASTPFTVDEPGSYVFELTVTDMAAGSDTDQVTVTTNAATITQISPTTGPPGTAVTITGTNFSPSATGNDIAFDGLAASSVPSSSTQLVATVPAAAPTGTGPVTVTIVETGQVVTGPTFEVTAPASPWTIVDLNTVDDFISVSFANSSFGVTLGENRNVLRTTDGGSSWSPLTGLDSQYGSALAVSLPHPDTVFALTFRNTGSPTTSFWNLHRSDDAGATWTPVSGGGVVGAAFDMTFVDPSEGWAVGNGGTILHSTDGGASWTPQMSGTTQVLRHLFFANNQVGIALGDGNTVVRTADGGANWTATTLSGSSILWDVWMADPTNGIIVGQDAAGGATVFATSDGGVTWTPIAHNLPSPFRALGVSMPTASVAVVVGQVTASERSIYRSVDVGVTWTRETFTSPYLMEDVFMFDSTTGVAVGNGYAFVRK
jgi:photosystem II stability/assembly factor-like uncharacterized protein